MGCNILSGDNPIAFNIADPLPLFIVQTVIILSLCYGINMIMYRIRQPRVVSEVVAGIILGPSILGKIPGFNETIFPAKSLPFLNLVAELGLVLFLFLVGLELDPKLILKRAKHALGISIAGLVIPFMLSCGVSILLHNKFEQATETRPSPPLSQFILCCGVAFSLTAFPVLARILAEMQLMSTSVGFITICSAAAVDIVAWILLALLVSLIHATTPIMPLYVILMSTGFCLILVYVVRPVLMSLEEEPSQKMIAITLVIVLSSSFITHIIGIHSIFGGFLVGLLIPHDSGFAEGLTRRIEDLVGVYFLPIFFACSGLKTEVGLLNTAETWGLVILVTVLSFVGKMFGCVGAAKLNGMTWRECLSIGFLMNCKGLVEYIILNIGHDFGVISDRVFVIMIAMCLILTIISTPLVYYLYPVSYQKELEVRREAERKKQALQPKTTKNDSNTSQDAPTGFIAKLASKVRRRRGSKEKMLEKNSQGNSEGDRDHYEDLDGVQVDDDHQNANVERENEITTEESWRKRNSIMFCLDKTPNAPGVMTLLQLFSGTAIRRGPRSAGARGPENGAATNEKLGQGSGHTNDKRHGSLHPSIDISDPEGNHRTQHQRKTRPEYEINYSNIYAIRMLHISERTSAAMLTASRCMDRLYKDTVMMMVMAFAKLNSVPLKPLVAISTDTAQSTVAQDILDRAEDLNVGWIVYPWNSSHLIDVRSSGAGLASGGVHLQPGVMMSLANTTATAQSTIMSISGSPTAASDPAHLASLFATSSEPLVEPPRQFPYNISRYFDHEEALKIASGGHFDLSQSSQTHRTSIASNTKVLSKLIPSSAASNISTAVLVDHGLGLSGGVEHIVVPLLGGEDDYETLCLASCLARSTRCFVTVLRVATPQTLHQQQLSATSESQAYTFQRHSQQWSQTLAAHDTSIPGTPDVTQRPSSRSTVNLVPKDDETLFKKFFACKPPFQGGQQLHRQQILQRNRELDRTGHHLGAQSASLINVVTDDDDEDDECQIEEGVMVINFQDFTDAIQWSRSYLTAQDLLIIGFDSPLSTQSSPAPAASPASSSRPFTVGFSRVPSMEECRPSVSDTKFHSSTTPTVPATSPTILERRGMNLSTPRTESLIPPSSPTHSRLLPLQNPALNASSISTPAITGTDEERTGRFEATATSRGRSPSRGARSIRSMRSMRSIRSASRGRKAETPGAGMNSSQAQASAALTTCQVMLGIAADKMMHAGVSSSLLVVRSRWFSERKARPLSEASSLFHGLGHLKLNSTNMTSTGSYHRGGSIDHHQPQSPQRMQDQARQYHTQQQQHHAQQHSKHSEELTRTRVPDVTFVDMSGAGTSDDGSGGGASTDAMVRGPSASDKGARRKSRDSL
ncbi:K(+)/H(+) antiporter [Haplosporangium sp. Z 767]|nr:K(+)/H(+) antiporter [Haplosporangium sp. Z 767]